MEGTDPQIHPDLAGPQIHADLTDPQIHADSRRFRIVLGLEANHALDSVLLLVYSILVTPLIVIDWSVDEPVYAQIARQIRAAIASGALAAGDLLPPVRTIASDLGVNLNTVARAYRLLDAEGFVAIEEREGVRVQAPARRADRAATEVLCEELAVLLARMRQAGISAAEIRRRVERELPEGARVEGVRRKA